MHGRALSKLMILPTHSQIESVRLTRHEYIYLCTNGMLVLKFRQLNGPSFSDRNDRLIDKEGKNVKRKEQASEGDIHFLSPQAFNKREISQLSRHFQLSFTVWNAIGKFSKKLHLNVSTNANNVIYHEN